MPTDATGNRQTPDVLRKIHRLQRKFFPNRSEILAFGSDGRYELLSQCEKTRPVPVSPWIGDQKVFEAARRALIRAHYAPWC